MSKELEMLKIIKIKCHPNSNPNPLVDEALDIVEQALQLLEAIKQSSPSEALESLEIMRCNLPHYYVKEYNTVKQELLKAQEQEKVLDIIKEKNVDIIYLKDSNTVEEYNSHFGCAVCKLTQEEFELLKKYFND